jgi:hypothetical protein
VKFAFLGIHCRTRADVYTALKWGTHTALQLSAEEVLHLADLIGFDVDISSLKSVDSLYAAQPDMLLKYTYGERPLFFERYEDDF